MFSRLYVSTSLLNVLDDSKIDVLAFVIPKCIIPGGYNITLEPGLKPSFFFIQQPGRRNYMYHLDWNSELSYALWEFQYSV